MEDTIRSALENVTEFGSFIQNFKRFMELENTFLCAMLGDNLTGLPMLWLGHLVLMLVSMFGKNLPSFLRPFVIDDSFDV